MDSVSISLADIETDTTIELDPALDADRFELDGEVQTDTHRVTAFLDIIRGKVGVTTYARVTSRNSFPTASGMASSASGFAALCKAAAHAYGLSASEEELSALARLGSGSAARSIAGGFVHMRKGEATDGHDASAIQIAAPEHWDLRIIVCVTTPQAKDVPSRQGMKQSAETSPFYTAWIDSCERDVPKAIGAIEARDFDALTQVTERSCLNMHSVMMSTQPPLLYWEPTTLALIHHVQRLRREGVPVCFTIDAGPHVFIVTPTQHERAVVDSVEQLSGIDRVIVSKPGPGARLL